MERTTRKMVTNQFKLLCEALGKKQSDSYKDKGAWNLEYIAYYGGYSIVEFLESGGEGQPFGARRRSASEMFDVINFALRAVELDRNNGNSGSYYPQAKGVSA